MGVFGLRYNADLRVLLWEVIYFAVSIHLWNNMYEMSWPMFIANFFVCTVFSFLGATITHNAIHVPLFRDNTGLANSLFQIVLSMTYGWPVSALIPGHNLSHHKFTNGPKDAMRTTQMRYESQLLNYFMFPVSVSSRIAKYDMEYMDVQRKESRPIWKQYVREAAVFYTFQVACAVYDWRRYFVVWFIPQLYAKFQIIGMNTMQHDGCPQPGPNVSKDDLIQYQIARNFTGGIVNFLTFNNGYHTVHHITPGLHWSFLAAEHDKIAAKIHPNLNQPNMLTWWWQAHIWPGKRTWYDGSDYALPPEVPDEPWYDPSCTETYSAPSSLAKSE